MRRTTSNVAMQNGGAVLESELGQNIERFNEGKMDESTLETTRRNSTGSYPRGPQKCLRCGSTEHFWRQCPHPFRKNLMFGRESENKDRKGETSAARNNLKHALLSITDDLLNFDLGDTNAHLNIGPTDDTPMVEGESVETTQETGQSFIWMRNVFRVNENLREGGMIIPVSSWILGHLHR